MTTPPESKTPQSDGIQKKIFAILRGLSDVEDIPAILHAVSLEIAEFRTAELKLNEALAQLAEANRKLKLDEQNLLAIQNDRLEEQKQLAEATKDKERLDWLDRNLLHLYDGGGAYGIEFGALSNPIKLDWGDGDEPLCNPRHVIDHAMKYAAMKPQQSNQGE